MQRKFITNLGLLLLLNLLIKPFWVFGIDRTVQNVVGAEEFGFYYTILNFSFLFNILLDLGVTNFNNRNIAQNTQLLAKHFSGIVSLKLILGFLYFIVTIGIGLLWGYRGSQLSLLALVGFNQFLLSFILYIRSNISGMLMFRTESFMSVLDRSLMIIIMAVLLWGHVISGEFQIEWFVYAQTSAYIIAAIIGYSVVVIKSKSLAINWNIPFFLMILRKSMPFALLTLLMTFYNRIDTVMIDKLLPNEIGNIQSGVYAHAYRILEATNQISFLFAILLLPLFSHLIKAKESLINIVRVSFSLLFVATSILAICTFFYSYEIMELLYDEHISESSSVYSVIIFGVMAMGTSYIFGTLLTANGSLKELNTIAAISLIISVTLNLVLVPKYHAFGSAVANLSALSFSSIAQLYVVKSKFNFKIDNNFIIRLFGFIIFTLIISYTSTFVITYNWVLKLVFVSLSSLLIAVLMKLLSIKEFVEIIKNDQLK
ncbi:MULTISPECIES: oligosaccharide flippase family protein [unclassified Lentimicrobium]|uniref:oligosaccharide flippase family protein n=1 Tax=unclassified Lentimicrobium TaxID=2677434 RepID=UPI0015516AEB|nr:MULTISPECIES: oligosaccharide flippase family protein [unclassified Lentimicrobium]NPD46492.1 oligosaccharide flippase family protein [Lentimicrobium sp. S6]NPD85998.1 oligosaccharide flippase family protein [Lentimicrobium sp. L6]